MKDITKKVKESADKKSDSKAKQNINLKKIGSKTLNIVLAVITEVILVALAIQGLLSMIHAKRSIQIGVSFTFVFLLLIARHRAK
jgi:hypothetical protein